MKRKSFLRENNLEAVVIQNFFFCVVILGLKNVNLNNLSL